MDSFEDKDILAVDLLKMLELGSSNDVKIKLSDGEIHANKDILVARSEYFATMLSNSKFVEGKTSSVDMSHCSKAVMDKIIKFLFSGAITFKDLSLPQLLELSHMTEMMLLSKVKVKADRYLTLNIRRCGLEVKWFPELVTGLKLADKYKLDFNKSIIIQQLHISLKHVPVDVQSSDSFKTLPFNMIREILLLKVINHGFNDYVGRNLPTNKQRFQAFMVWLSQNENEITEEEKNEIVDSYDFEAFAVEESGTLAFIQT